MELLKEIFQNIPSQIKVVFFVILFEFIIYTFSILFKKMVFKEIPKYFSQTYKGFLFEPCYYTCRKCIWRACNYS